jgi:hypothetical protein
MPYFLITTCPSVNPSRGPALSAPVQRPFVLSRILARVYQGVGDRPEYMFNLMTQSTETRINLVVTAQAAFRRGHRSVTTFVWTSLALLPDEPTCVPTSNG